ncbi:hypothetical protein G6011_10154 [Alternaria panax]|uniref:Heterokaryon incompatibility domain-containing protein n=1 Tax=Alternaria panax TaxID=48097 RepID=A0AAD4I7U8_9PLEO|nr:hypothetical protein G6011_10154 [Alternaria panax]
MRLIDCRSDWLRMQEFIGPPPVPFAILSHTWDSEEVNFQAFNDIATRTAAKGWIKIEQTCREAQRCGFDYVWIDSCCIDKTNNAELSESINSMFQWYSEAELCLVYLADFDANATDSERDTMLVCARWFSRGWTMQEIIAARAANFYDRAWCQFGTRASLRDELASITNIDVEVFTPPQGPDALSTRGLLDTIPVGRRMSWAASRQTTRPEDVAYCLIGLFQVNMPMLYGEGGEQAFIRLQEEIMRDRNDLSLFAWRARDSSTDRGILARSPDEFAGLSSLKHEQDIRFNPEFSMSNKGLRINTFLKLAGDKFPGEVIMPLHCYTETPMGKSVPQTGVFLKHEGASVYVRTRPQSFALLTDSTPVSSSNTIFISKRVRTAGTTVVHANHAYATGSNISAVCFTIPGINAHLQSEHHVSAKLLEVEPKDLWDAHNNVFLTRDMRNFTAFLRFQIRGLRNFGGEFVLAYGFAESVKPWVLLGDETDELFAATATHDFRHMARIGAARGSLRSREKYLRTPMNPQGSLSRYASIKLQCSQEVRSKEMALVLKLSFYKGSRMTGFLFRD